MNGVTETNGHEAGAHFAPYSILMHSHEYGTSGIDCPTLPCAAQALAWLAERAEQQRHLDGEQRYFCLLSCTDEGANGEDNEDGPSTLLSDALILRLTSEGLAGIVAEGLEERPVIALEQPQAHDCPLLCWEVTSRPLSALHPHERQALRTYLRMRDLRGTSEPTTGADQTAAPPALPPDPVLLAWQAHTAETSSYPTARTPGGSCSSVRGEEAKARQREEMLG